MSVPTEARSSKPDQTGVAVRLVRKADGPAVARLHAESITEGFLSKLGRRFLRQLYIGVAADQCSYVFVAGDGDDVLGFLAYSQDVSAMYRRVLRSHFLRLGFASLPRSLNPLLLKEIRDTLRYPAKQTARQLPPAEILSVGVDTRARGLGLGRRLIEATFEQARRDGQRQLKVLAGAKLEGANRFFPACGFEVLRMDGQRVDPCRGPWTASEVLRPVRLVERVLADSTSLVERQR